MVAHAGGGGGGGSQIITREELSGNGSAIADGDGAWLTWDSSGGPDTLIDRSTPAHPTIIDAGVYMVSVVVHATGALGLGGYFDAGLHLDRTGFNASMYATSSQADIVTGTGIVSDLTLSFAWYIPAGGQIGVFVDHTNDNGLPGGFAIAYAHIQQLSGGSGSLPAGGTTGQILTKASNADGDADWETMGANGSITVGDQTITSGPVNPSSGAGVPAFAGSLYLRISGTDGTLWLKVGSADTAWSQVLTDI